MNAQDLRAGADTSSAGGLPLHPTRDVGFSVTKGTWISLDVSPDGRTIVFELLGDLYSIPIEGGKARRLTSGTAFNRQPRYSPDGRHLVFVSDRSGSANVWITDQHGNQGRQLSNLRGYPSGAVTSPAWSPDGRTIVVSQMLGATRTGLVGRAMESRWLLAAYDLQSGRMRWVSDTTPDHPRAALGATFDGQGRLYASVDAIRPDPWSDIPYWRIARVDLRTGRIEPEMGSLTGRVGMRPAVSPDGRFLVYASSSGSHPGFRLRDLHTDREWWLAREVLDDPPINVGADSRDLVPGYAFTPDSKSLIAAYGGLIHRINLGTGVASVIPFVADIKRGLGPLTIRQFSVPDTTLRTRSIMQPALSPDGHWVAFSALDRIWVMELPRARRPAGKPRRLTSDSVGEFFPSWSPDGSWLAYSTWEDGQGGAIRRVSFSPDASSGPHRSERLTSDSALYFHTAVALNGKRIVALRTLFPLDGVVTFSAKLSNPILVWIPSSGGAPNTIALLGGESFGWDVYPVDQIYFRADPERIWAGLTSWNWAGSDRQRFGVSGLENSFELLHASGVLSPTARRALVMRNFTLFEVTWPSWGSEGSSTVDLNSVRSSPPGSAAGAAHRWGTAIGAWVSWSRDGQRVIFNQGGTIFVGNVRPDEWTAFEKVDVPLPIPVDIPRGIMVLRGARFITMRGREVIPRGELVVRDNRIVALGPLGSVAIPSGARVLDVAGTTILPGYVDTHDHMYLPRGVHPQQPWQNLAKLAYGVTAGRDPNPARSNDVFTYRERERTGELLGPRIFSTGVPYLGTDPSIKIIEDAREAVRPNADYFASETFKVYVDPSTGRAAWQLLAQATAEKGLNATAHINSVELAMKVVADGFSGLEHAPQNRIYDDVATLSARSGTIHTQTFVGVNVGAYAYLARHFGGPWQWQKTRTFAPPSVLAESCFWCANPWFGPPELSNLIPLLGTAAMVVTRGGLVAIGSHGDIPGLGFHYELWLHKLGGMRNHDILRSATMVGATAIGHSKDFGSLELGKLADLQVLDKNPLEDIHNTTSIRYVMKNGRLYEADNLTEIWPRHRPLPPIYLWEPKTPSDPRLRCSNRGKR